MRDNPIRAVIRRIVSETKRPFFEVEQWPVSELTKWIAHFYLEHDEINAIKSGNKPGVSGGIKYITNEKSTVEQKNAAVMAIF